MTICSCGNYKKQPYGDLCSNCWGEEPDDAVNKLKKMFGME